MPYLLSPAGSAAALAAAIDAGADEVYLGGNAFNARINASNFNEEGLINAGELCRASGVRLHITLNTLIYEKEFPSVLEYVGFLENRVRPDALIVQDIGLAHEIKKLFPSLPLHASTQMRIHSPRDAEYLLKLGFTRAVLAREMPLCDIAAFAKTGIESEIFIHGALCVCESGGCLMSAVIGGRSGNRGECAQPCRLPYRGGNGYPLSLKDLCLATHMREIINSGVTSLKIEGRMKSPEYVGAVTSVYRRLIDEGRDATKDELLLLEQAFTRGGFTDGYFTSRIGKEMFGIRSDADKRKTAALGFVPEKAKRRADDGYKPFLPKPVPPNPAGESIMPPSVQKGLVLRFEGGLPSRGFLSEYGEKACRIDVRLCDALSPLLDGFCDKAAVIMPRLCFESELAGIKDILKRAYARGIHQAVISSFYHIELCDGFFLHGDYALNIVNPHSLKVYEGYPLSSVMLSPEAETKSFNGSTRALEYIVYGRLPLMHTQTCIIRNLRECGRDEKSCRAFLTDRTGASFPVFGGEGHRNTIYNSLPTYKADKKKELKKVGIGLLTLMFTTETEAEMSHITSLALASEAPDFKYTRR